MFCQTGFFFARFGQIQYAAGNSAIWKHQLQSHVPLLCSSSTCYLSAKISKLAYSRPASGESTQGLGMKDSGQTSPSHRRMGFREQLYWATSSRGWEPCLVHTTDYGNMPPWIIIISSINSDCATMYGVWKAQGEKCSQYLKTGAGIKPSDQTHAEIPRATLHYAKSFTAELQPSGADHIHRLNL